MNILLVYEFYTPHVGGGEIALQHLAEGLAAHGHQVDLITSRLPDTAAEETLNGVHIHRVALPSWSARYWFMVCSFKSIFTRAKTADVIHTFTYSGVLSTWLAATLRRKPKVLTVHEYWGELWQKFSGLPWWSAWLHRWVERSLFFFHFDRTVAVSNFTAQRLHKLGVNQSTLSVIHQGIDEQLFHSPDTAVTQRLRQDMGVTDACFVYVFFGRPGLSKGVEFLLQAVPAITTHIPNSQLWMILAPEPADQYAKMQALIEQFDIQHHIRLISPVPRAELPTYIAAAQAVVVPSLSEGFGFSVAESCRVGTPVVASRVGSIPEVISGQFVLIEPAQAEEITRGVLAIQRGDTTHTPLKRFTWETTIKAYTDLYLGLIAKA